MGGGKISIHDGQIYRFSLFLKFYEIFNLVKGFRQIYIFFIMLLRAKITT